MKWFSSLIARSPDEEHRAATPLELFFDLVFVVAIAQASLALHHGIAEDHINHSIINFLTVFFAIWWAWMNFTWFASAYDNDDTPYRLAVFVQMSGALILAAGVQDGFEHNDFRIVTAGYVIMRLAMVWQWLRAGFSDPQHRASAFRYAAGIAGIQVLWVLLNFWFHSHPWHFYLFLVLIAGELLVPVWAERKVPTTWHPEHITERYGLFTIIVLGESILATSMGIQSATEYGGLSAHLIQFLSGGLLILFSMWWFYFEQPEHDLFKTLKSVFVWGYGHYFIFGSAAAVGAGLSVVMDQTLHHAEIGTQTAAAVVAIPVAVYLLSIWFIHLNSGKVRTWHKILTPVVSLMVLFTPLLGEYAILTIGILLAVLVCVKCTTSGVRD